MLVDHLSVFGCVARHRNVSRAAGQLHISQPAVTKHLRLLEETYNTKLYTRGGRGIELTDAGRMIFKYVKSVQRQHDRLLHRLDAVTSGAKSNSLTVGGSYSPSMALLPSLLSHFRKLHPQIHLALRTGNKLAVEEMILRGDVELAVINNAPHNEHLNMEFHRSVPLVAFVAPGHLLARKKTLGWEDLRQIGFIIRKEQKGREAFRDYTQYLRKQGFRPNVVMRFDNPTAVKEAVRNKSGVGILYRDAVEIDIKRGQFKLIKMPGDTFMGKSFIIYHKTRPLSPLAQKFLTLLRSYRDRV